tara:strand:+ start:751 stop:912 length:162 start_codon:yes stop_codon:yes gene_type:complete
MTYSYKWFDDRKDLIERTDEGGNISIIPIETANTDYQEYLKWVEEGNTAEDAD